MADLYNINLSTLNKTFPKIYNKSALKLISGEFAYQENTLTKN